MRNVPNKAVGDSYTSQEFDEGSNSELKNMITDTSQNFDNSSETQLLQSVILASGNRFTYVENTGSTGAAYKVKNLQSNGDQAKFIQDGFKFTLIFTNENTVTNPTIEFDGIVGTYNILDNESNPIKLSLFKLDSIVDFIFDGTNILVASIFTSQEDINKNNSYTSVYTSPNYLLTNDVVNPSSYYNGMLVNFIADATSNAAVTVTIDGLTTIPLIKGSGEVSYNDIINSSLVSIIYFNGNFYLLKNKDNFVVNNNNTYSVFDNDNISRRSAFNIAGILTYDSDTTLLSTQSHQKIKVSNLNNTVQLTLPQLSTCDDNCEFPIMIESSDHAVSFVSHATELIRYNGITQQSVNFIVDNGSFLLKKDSVANTWFLSGYSQENGAVVGSVIMTFTNIVPRGYIYCDGTLQSRTQNLRLFSAIGTAFGVGDGSTTFGIPDLRGMMLKGAGSALSAPIGTMQGDAIKNITGEFRAGMRASQYASGAFYLGSSLGPGFNGSDGTQYVIHFDAGRVVDTADEVRTRNFSVYYYIKK